MNTKVLVGIYLSITLAVLGMFVYGVFWAEDPREIPSEFDGKPAPNFALTSFDGQQLDLGGLSGKPVILNFWASWCVPCRKEAVDLQAAHVAYSPQDVVFVGIATNDSTADAQAFIAEFGITFFMAPAESHPNIHLDYGVAGIPETFFITPEGIIVNKITGAVTIEHINAFLREQNLL